MVSGFVTSPCDQDMIVSGDANESFSASKFSSLSTSTPSSQLTQTPSPSRGRGGWGCRRFCSATRQRSFARVFPELFALEADTEVQRDLGNVFFAQNNLALVLAQDLDPERKHLKLLDQHSERLRDAGFERVVALDDRLVGLDATHDVVRFDCQDLLQDVRGAVSLERPHLHLAKALAAELRLAAQRLLGDQAVGTSRTGVDLVLDQVSELEHVDHSDGHRLVELFAGAAVTQPELSVLRRARALELGPDRLHRCAVQKRRRDFYFK